MNRTIGRLTLLFIIFPFLLHAQTVKIAIKDNNGNSVYGSSISINGKRVIENNNKRVFQIQVKKNDTITISTFQFKKYNFIIRKSIGVNDTIHKLIKIKPNYQYFSPVTITATSTNTIFKKPNVFIIDYYPISEKKILLILQKNSNYFLELIKENGKLIDTLKHNIKPKHLFLDALGNFHILCKNTVYQINLTNGKIEVLPPIKIEEFNKYLKNLVAINNNGGFYQKLRMHNQMYLLMKVKNKTSTLIYRYLDSLQYKIARQDYNKVIKLYMQYAPKWDNVITSGHWDGKLMHLHLPPSPKIPPEVFRKMTSMTSWSINIASKPLNVISFGKQNGLVVLNGEKDSIFTIDYKTLKLKDRLSTNLSLSGQYFFDYFHDIIYMVSNKEKPKKVFQINTQTGYLSLVKKITQVSNPYNIKVVNGNVYFLLLDENHFNRLLKVK